MVAPLTGVAAPQPPQVKPVVTGCDQWQPLIDKYGWDTNIAQAVMRAENGACNPVKDNAGLNHDGSVDYGLFQVNSIHTDMVGGNLESLRDPEVNIRVAHQVYSGSGWTAWSTYNNGKYRQYLK